MLRAKSSIYSSSSQHPGKNTNKNRLARYQPDFTIEGHLLTFQLSDSALQQQPERRKKQEVHGNGADDDPVVLETVVVEITGSQILVALLQDGLELPLHLLLSPLL